MPGFNRRSDWDEYFDQVFNGHYQARLARGEDVKNFMWPDGYPLNGIPEVRALARPPRNAKEFDWGSLDQPDNEMGDGRMVQWAEKFLADPPKQPFFLAAGIYRPHLPWYAPREYFDMYPPDGITPPLIKEDDLDDLPEAGLIMAEQRRGDLELVRRSGQYQRILQAQPVDHKVFLHEGNIAPGDAPDELKIVMRTAQYEEDSLTTDPPRAYSSISRDGGHTWSPGVPEPDLHNAKSKGYFGRASDGTHIYVYNDGPAQRDVAPGFPHGGRTSQYCSETG
jgi:hypothetical protein